MLRSGTSQVKSEFFIDFGGTKISHMTQLNLFFIIFCVYSFAYNICHICIQIFLLYFIQLYKSILFKQTNMQMSRMN